MAWTTRGRSVPQRLLAAAGPGRLYRTAIFMGSAGARAARLFFSSDFHRHYDEDASLSMFWLYGDHLVSHCVDCASGTKTTRCICSSSRAAAVDLEPSSKKGEKNPAELSTLPARFLTKTKGCCCCWFYHFNSWELVALTLTGWWPYRLLLTISDILARRQ